MNKGNGRNMDYLDFGAESLLAPLSTTSVSGAVLEILYPTRGRLRARDITRRSQSRASQRYPSWKMRRMMQAESPHELNSMILLDVNPRVRRYHEQPLIIRYVMNGREHLHFPDLLVELQPCLGELPGLLEVKPDRAARDPEIMARTQLMRAELPKHGFRYGLALAGTLARKPRLSNAQLLLDHGRAPLSELAREQLRQLFLSNGTLPWAAVLEGTLGIEGRQAICRLILEGRVGFDINQPLTPDTRLQWVNTLQERDS
jgi:hypothetical protein